MALNREWHREHRMPLLATSSASSGMWRMRMSALAGPFPTASGSRSKCCSIPGAGHSRRPPKTKAGTKNCENNPMQSSNGASHHPTH